MLEKLDFTTLSAAFADEDKARDIFETLRWPDSPACLHCGGAKAYRITPNGNGRTSARKGLLKCKECRKQFTVTVGTIFERSKIPLNKWLYAIHLMCSAKKGVSAHQLHRELDITYKSAWFMAHRVRYAMNQPPLKEKLNGIVEADETYIGGKGKKGSKRGRGAEKKVPVSTPNN